MPLTELSGWPARYCELILPPKDLPETNSGSLEFNSCAFLIAASIVMWAIAGESGLPFLCSAKGKLNRRVAMPTFERESASVSINEWSIPAPAPCASVKMHLGLSGTIYLAEMIPTEGETSNLKDCVLMAGSKLNHVLIVLCDKFANLYIKVITITALVCVFYFGILTPIMSIIVLPD